MEVEDTDFAHIDDATYWLQTGAVEVFLVFPVLDKAMFRDVALKLRAGDEVVVGGIPLTVVRRAACVCNTTTTATDGLRLQGRTALEN